MALDVMRNEDFRDYDTHEIIYGCLLPNNLEVQVAKRRDLSPDYHWYQVRVVSMDRWTTWGQDDALRDLMHFYGEHKAIFVGVDLDKPEYLHILATSDEDEALFWAACTEDWLPAMKVWDMEKPQPNDEFN